MAQLNLLVGDIAGNRDQIIAAIAQARDEHGADVVVFSELALTGYPPEDLLLRPDFLRACETALADIQAQCQGITAIVGAPLRQGGALFNTARVMRDGKLLATASKQRLPNYSVFDEVRYFAAGDEPTVVELAPGLRAGISICEDIWYPGPAAALIGAGANCIINLNASPFHLKKDRQRLQTLRARIEETALPILYVNQVGGQDELVFDGASMALDRNGEVQVQAPVFETAITPVDLTIENAAVIVQPGEKAVQAVDDALLYQALVTGVRDYVNKNGFAGAVLGLSGGIDSALTLAIAVDALGAERVTAVMMPSEYTASMSLEDAEAEASALGVEYHVIPIRPAFEAFNSMLAEVFAKTGRDVTEENLQARSRGVVLMAISNKLGRMVLTTGNKSEVAVGYATLYGDMAGGFSPLKDVYKTHVYSLCRYRNGIAPVIPQRVLERPPSAELAPDQTDQDSLPPYDVLDSILRSYIEKDRSAEDIIASGNDPAVVADVIRRVDRNEYKRRQAAPGIKLTERAFGRDRRYPITSGYRP